MRSLVVLVLFFALFASANMHSKNEMGKKEMGMFQSVEQSEATLLQEGSDKLYCPNCGMNLPKFYKTNHAVKLKNGEVRQYCSIYCYTEEREFGYLRDKRELIEMAMVIDVSSLKFINVEDAHYVVGSNKPGTMSKTSKYAFAKIEDAKEFAKNSGGEVVDFEKAYNSALSDFEKDREYVISKREGMAYKLGEKLYKSCDKKLLKDDHIHTIGELKAAIRDKNICGEGLDDRELQGVSLYIWDKKLNR